MTIYKPAALSILLLSTTNVFLPHIVVVHSFTIRKTHHPFPITSRSASISALYNEEGNGSKNENAISMTSSLGDVVRTVKVAYIDSTEMVAVLSNPENAKDQNAADDNDDKRTMVKEKKQRVVVVDALNNVPTFVYDVTLPIVGQNVDMCLKQIDVNGVVSETALDVDSLKYISAEQDVIRNKGISRTMSEEGPDGTFQIMDEERVRKVTMDSIVVSSIKRGGLAWNLGIRAGDMLVATSATLGDVSIHVFGWHVCTSHI
jgi:hypothetical protein